MFSWSDITKKVTVNITIFTCQIKWLFEFRNQKRKLYSKLYLFDLWFVGDERRKMTSLDWFRLGAYVSAMKNDVQFIYHCYSKRFKAFLKSPFFLLIKVKICYKKSSDFSTKFTDFTDYKSCLDTSIKDWSVFVYH